MNKKLFNRLTNIALRPALCLTMILSLAACAGTGSGGSSSDLASRVSAVENKVGTLSNQIEGTQSADVWNQLQNMNQQLNVMRNQVNDLDTRMSGPKGAEVLSYNQRLERLEMAIRQLASQLGVKVEALDTPYTPPPTSQNAPQDVYNPDPYAQQQKEISSAPPYGAAGAVGAAGMANVGQNMPINDPYATPPDPAMQASAAPATNPDGTVTVMINGVPRQVQVANPNAAPANPVPAPEQNTGPVTAPPGAAVASATSVAGGATAAAPSAGGDLAQDLYDQGMGYFNKGQYKEALKCFKDFSDNYAKNNLISNAWFWQGECNYQLKDYPGAVVAYQKVITNYSKSNKYVSSLLKQGMALSAAGNKEAAKVRWKEIVNRYPKDPEAARAKKLLAGGK